MRLIRTRDELPLLDEVRAAGALVLVPTMGALHAGHLSLVEIGRRHGPVVVSIFVNPTQFGPEEDFAAYPRQLEEDLSALQPLDVAAVFAPDVADMYAGSEGVRVVPGPRAAALCGAVRPGHFTGVLTVVAKLLHLVRPGLAVFGRKDAQQCLVIQEMVRDLDFPVGLIDAPTLREEDGLAMSSRNRYLSAGERERALCLIRALRRARQLLQDGEREVAALTAVMTAELAQTDRIDYVAVRSVPELTAVGRATGHLLLAVAAQVGPARLIDNLVLQVSGESVSSCSLLGSDTSS